MRNLTSFVLAGILAAAPLGALAQGDGADDGVLKATDLQLTSESLSDNIRLHTVQRKLYSDKGMHEITLYPAIVQLNSKFTTHVGAGAQYLYHLHENFSLQVNGQFNYLNRQVDFVQELIDNSQIQPQPATALTLQWAATAGFEIRPIYGKIAFYDSGIAHFGVVISAGAGLGGTRIQLTGDEQGLEFGSAGTRFVGQIGAGFRVRFDENFVARLEIRDTVYTAMVDRINGCSVADFNAIEDGGQVSGSCRWQEMSEDARIQARELIRKPSSDVLNNVGVYAGISYTF
mgnify:CR=1 FL=1